MANRHPFGTLWLPRSVLVQQEKERAAQRDKELLASLTYRKQMEEARENYDGLLDRTRPGWRDDMLRHNKSERQSELMRAVRVEKRQHRERPDSRELVSDLENGGLEYLIDSRNQGIPELPWDNI